MSELLIWLAMVFGPSLLVLAWIKAEEWLACREDEVDLEPAPDLAANVVFFDRMGVTR
ncbi:hypothetical protein L2K70_04880 [Nocardioides KLBMP 9356]|uniref:Cbb3-type cytochrome oxidase assembly protein CcoS n=1 Tax=Nocardioides potassii TaxID=2911371 RepID=A0ABS9H6S1_9ACTN|nr:hypothetical protein [Nocardioides potassii]MCF6376930.1 hypothetical protein [Nocardioides potassii]